MFIVCTFKEFFPKYHVSYEIYKLFFCLLQILLCLVTMSLAHPIFQQDSEYLVNSPDALAAEGVRIAATGGSRHSRVLTPGNFWKLTAFRQSKSLESRNSQRIIKDSSEN